MRASKNDWKGVGVPRANLRKDLPGVEPEELVEKTAETGNRLSDRGRLPVLLKLEEKQVLPDLILGERLRVRVEMALQEPQLAVVGVSGATAVVAQGQQLGVSLHGRIGVVVGQWFRQNSMPERAVGRRGSDSFWLRGRGTFCIVHSRPFY